MSATTTHAGAGTGAGTDSVLAGRPAWLTRHRAGRIAAAACGVAAVLLFPRPWVRASLVGVGEVPLSGLELARADASRRVDAAVFGQQTRGGATGAGAVGRAGASSTAAGSSAVTGGLTLPTRVPTVPAGSAPGAAPAAPAAGAAGSASAGRATSIPQAAAGGLTLPTRVPTVAAGSAPPQAQPAQPTQLGQGGATGAPAPPAAPAKEPEPLPQFSLYFLLAAAIGLAVFPLVWERQRTERDRRFGLIWTLVVSYGGALWGANILRVVVTAPADNVLIGPGVGGTLGAEPALWVVCGAFVLGAAALTVSWTAPRPKVAG